LKNVLTVNFVGTKRVKSMPLYQWDYGQVLKFGNIQNRLPLAYEVHFANAESGNSTTQIGDENGVIIPDTYLTTGLPVYAWVYLHEGNSDGETEYKVEIPVIKRAKPTNAAPTPVQQDVITQAIAALNEAVEQTGSDAALTEQWATEAGESAESAAESAEKAMSATPEGYDALVHTVNGIDEAIADEFNADTYYAKGKYVWRNNELYCFKANHPAGAWSSADVDKVVLTNKLKTTDDLAHLTAETLTSTISSIAEPFSPSKAYSKGEYCWRQSKLNRFTADHPAGEWIGTDAEEVKLTDDISVLISRGKSIAVIGVNPVIVAEDGKRYICGELETLTLTPSATGICDVLFTSGTTPTVLSVPNTVVWANGFDPTSLEANKIYELNIAPSTYGLLGVACSWDYAESDPVS